MLTGIASGHQPKKCQLLPHLHQNQGFLFEPPPVQLPDPQCAGPFLRFLKDQGRDRGWEQSWELWAEFTQTYFLHQLQLYYLPQMPLVLQAWDIALPGPVRWLSSFWAFVMQVRLPDPSEVLFADLGTRLHRRRGSLTSPTWAGVCCAYTNFTGLTNHPEPWGQATSSHTCVLITRFLLCSTPKVPSPERCVPPRIFRHVTALIALGFPLHLTYVDRSGAF